MQTLGVSESTPKTENRLQSLFWPSINTATDVDYLGTQGYWLCTFVGVVTLVYSLIASQVLFGMLYLVFYYLGGVGVRQGSRSAAAIVAFMSSIETLVMVLNLFMNVKTISFMVNAMMVIHVLLTALLLANVRATWIGSRWKMESEGAALPPRLGATWSDKLADQLPMWLWPRIEILYYIYSAGFIGMMIVIWWMY